MLDPNVRSKLLPGCYGAGDVPGDVREAAHKVVTQMVTEGLLEVHPGIGTVVAGQADASVADTTKLLNKELEQLVVEAKTLGLELDEVMAAMEQHWRRLDGRRG
jgi:GntR family transcriptional regulator